MRKYQYIPYHSSIHSILIRKESKNPIRNKYPCSTLSETSKKDIASTPFRLSASPPLRECRTTCNLRAFL